MFLAWVLVCRVAATSLEKHILDGLLSVIDGFNLLSKALAEYLWVLKAGLDLGVIGLLVLWIRLIARAPTGNHLSFKLKCPYLICSFLTWELLSHLTLGVCFIPDCSHGDFSLTNEINCFVALSWVLRLFGITSALPDLGFLIRLIDG